VAGIAATVVVTLVVRGHAKLAMVPVPGRRLWQLCRLWR
jgi:hypothetical protein